MPGGDSIDKLDSFELCREKTDFMQVSVWAEITDGCLKISGQDFGTVAATFFGDDEYEYFYGFSKENTVRLISLITDNPQDFKDVFIQRFSGMDGVKALREFCQANDLTYKFFSC